MVSLISVPYSLLHDTVGCFAQCGQLFTLYNAPGDDDTVAVKVIDLCLCEHAPTFLSRKHKVLSVVWRSLESGTNVTGARKVSS